jgi:hypothetical protein
MCKCDKNSSEIIGLSFNITITKSPVKYLRLLLFFNLEMIYKLKIKINFNNLTLTVHVLHSIINNK